MSSNRKGTSTMKCCFILSITVFLIKIISGEGTTPIALIPIPFLCVASLMTLPVLFVVKKLLKKEVVIFTNISEKSITISFVLLFTLFAASVVGSSDTGWGEMWASREYFAFGVYVYINLVFMVVATIINMFVREIPILKTISD